MVISLSHLAIATYVHKKLVTVTMLLLCVCSDPMLYAFIASYIVLHNTEKRAQATDFFMRNYT